MSDDIDNSGYSENHGINHNNQKDSLKINDFQDQNYRLKYYLK